MKLKACPFCGSEECLRMGTMLCQLEASAKTRQSAEADQRFTVQTYHDTLGNHYILCRVMRVVRYELYLSDDQEPVLTMPGGMDQGDALREAQEFVEGVQDGDMRGQD